MVRSSTARKLGDLERETLAVLDRWERRNPPGDGLAREPVVLYAHGVPAEP
ncbi:hypothetical protein F8568_044995 [Actinomadura sp. LD22]|uniref:Uncharacterized protein n=1 Tax=Actinomadura physcomitrii TaxID=2650748 RepID=A0A6I4MTX2_9ACTN|nr:hypothetical protein [Actinomadura physcomitrii]MWA07367.1 hypothetical protein [Actinomadura physcomitrii]